MSVDLATVGQTVGDIEVQLSYRIIELFSGHLYSSPTKAVEELIANSYDAFATRCVASVPRNLEGAVWVWDNGDSMDMQGLKELWLVAETRKRDPKRENVAARRGRLPIGKFGIGKLASYVLGRRISHICRRNDSFIAVTMDYDRIPKEPTKLRLAVRKLSRDDVKKAVPFVVNHQYNGSRIDLFGQKENTWTLVVVDKLKQSLPLGRLEWILSTALPLVPDFRLFLNGKQVRSSKERIKVLQTWQIGKDDSTATEKLAWEVGRDPSMKNPFDHYVIVNGYGKVSGSFELFAEPLDVGKAADIGYSNGFFIMVRKRLINMQDNRFGITTIPLGVGFNRLRAVVHADFLDRYLTADREDTAIRAKRALAEYLEAKFNEVRNYYMKHVETELKEETFEEHLRSLPGTLTTYPLRQAIERISSSDHVPYTIRRSLGKPAMSTIQTIENRESSAGDPLAILEDGHAVINENHPFYQSFEDHPGVRRLAIAEILLEAYLLAAGVDLEKSTEVMAKRDQLLRVLASRFPEDAIEVSEMIRRSVSSQRDFEVSCVDGFKVLGFEAFHFGGKGKPDGLATAHLGIAEKRRYAVTVDAKSTQDEAVQSGNLGLATVARHRKEHRADYAVIIAPDYQVSEGEASKAVKEAREQKVCLLRAADFANLVATSAVKPLSLDELRALFDLCSPRETSSWIDQFKKECPASPPIRAILEAVWRMQTKDPKDAPSISAIKYEERSLKDEYSTAEIREWLISLNRLRPELVIVTGDKVQLNQTPENIVSQCSSVLRNVPEEISKESLLEGLQAN